MYAHTYCNYLFCGNSNEKFDAGNKGGINETNQLETLLKA